MVKNYTINQPRELVVIAQDLLNLALESENKNHQALMMALVGDLGVGKTALVKVLAKELGITETITSPTFNIIKLYPVLGEGRIKQLVHIDAYRIENVEEVRPLRLAEFLAEPSNLVCLEWPEKIVSVLPEKYLKVSMTITENEARQVEINTEKI
jgi:tRNA threonylcarbamoyladenosine biosynthesis protein TsaE